MNFVDEIEVRLGYLVALSGKYQMPVQISTMLYPGLSGVTQNDLATAEKKLCNDDLPAQEKEANDHAYRQFLGGAPLIRALLTRLCAGDMAAANAENAALIESGEGRIRRQLGEFDPDAANYRQENDRLMLAFHALKVDVPTQATLPVLDAFLAQRGISTSL